MKHVTLKEAEALVKKRRKSERAFYSKDKAFVKKRKKFEEKHCFGYTDCWNLDNTIAEFLLPRICYFRDNIDTCPSSILMDFAKKNKEDFNSISQNTEEEAFGEWYKILDCIATACYYYLKQSIDSYEIRGEKEETIKKGLNYLSEYFYSLWS